MDSQNVHLPSHEFARVARHFQKKLRPGLLDPHDVMNFLADADTLTYASTSEHGGDSGGEKG